MILRNIIVITLLLIALSPSFADNDIAKTVPVGDATLPDISIIPDIDKGQIELRMWQNGPVEKPNQFIPTGITITYPNGKIENYVDILFTNPYQSLDNGLISYFSTTIPINPVILWHPKSPNLYQIKLEFYSKQYSCVTSVTQYFGMRKYETRNGRFYINNQPFYLRFCGHEKEAFLDTLDRQGVMKRLTQVKRYGFNGIRHHSHVPSQMYLEIADQLGLLIQMEIEGKIGTDTASSTFAKSKENWISLIQQGRKHTSTFIYSMGNEIYQNDPGLVLCQNTLYDLAKQIDPSVLVLNRSGSTPANDDYGKYDLIERPIGEYEHTAEFAREAFQLYLRGDRKGKSDQVPIIAHEYPLVSSYPNPALSAKYSQEPFWITLAVENARKYHLEQLLPDYVHNAESIQAICRKEMLEEARKFRELDGYSMLRFTDRGEMVSGVVDDFADPKNVTAEEFLRTNGETVLLCTWNNRCFYYGDTCEVTLEISHHGETPFIASTCQWWLMNGAQVLAQGIFENVKVEPVDVAEIGHLNLVIPKLSAPAKLTLSTGLPGTRPYINNEWYFWAFPKKVIPATEQKKINIWDPRKRMESYLTVYPDIQYQDDQTWAGLLNPTQLLITDTWDKSYFGFLNSGGRIWIISDKSWPWPEEMGIFGLHITRFIPAQQAPVIFPELDEPCNKWLTICSNSKSRYGNSGTIIYPHPIFSEFPNEGFCDMQFWPMIYRAKSLELARFPIGTDPLIRTIDSYYRGVSKGYLVELGVGKGKLFISTLNLTQSFPRSVSTRYMFDQILRYLTGLQFQPTVTMSVSELQKMLTEFAKVYATREPLSADEMPARYTLRWKSISDHKERLTLPIYDAKGIDESRLGVHWEYAQTQWYLDALAQDTLSWDFETKTDSDFIGTIYLAGINPDISVSIQIDNQNPQQVRFTTPSGWEKFQPVQFQIPKLPIGKHHLTLSIASKLRDRTHRIVQVRDIDIEAQAR
ncbi:MAG: glycoside hydrolase family 2 TIM barrel-domain containing protein [bacterium]